MHETDHSIRTTGPRGWHVLREGATLTLARHLPARFDIGAEATFPPMDRLRLAHQVRQDMWRALRDLRGFSPVVQVTAQEGALLLRAGGRVAGPAPKTVLEACIAALLADPEKRARWGRFAGAGHEGLGLGTGGASAGRLPIG